LILSIFYSAPPPSGNQPVIIEQKKSNTCCIVTITAISLCVVVPIIIVVALFATAGAPPVPKYNMNICQPNSPAQFSTGGETWTADDVAHPLFGEMDPALADNSFVLHTPNLFNGNGDFDFPMNGPPAPLAATDCTFKVTPANSAEKIYIMGFPNVGVNMHPNKYITDLTTDMDCGETYLSINGVQKCGMVDMMSQDAMALMTPLEFNAGESVEFTLKTVDNADANFGFGFMIFTGTEAPGGPARSIYTTKAF